MLRIILISWMTGVRAFPQFAVGVKISDKAKKPAENTVWHVILHSAHHALVAIFRAEFKGQQRLLLPWN
ncbi:hypothetical protein [Salipiger mucosus]|uniref:hypothetical protein n=1 Tax=Salipiger mucosus TaxID=263378 RepID=UPI00035FB8DF|nr:hypothetical protein [Salipiger mucosus]